MLTPEVIPVQTGTIYQIRLPMSWNIVDTSRPPAADTEICRDHARKKRLKLTFAAVAAGALGTGASTFVRVNRASKSASAALALLPSRRLVSDMMN